MRNLFNPKVSIIIPVYNGSNYLQKAIDSAIAQTYKNIEIIVINDGSIDNEKTDSVCRSYGNKIKYFKKENGGVASALNFGIKNMDGEYFSWLSHDDEYYPNKVEKQVETLSKITDKNTIVYSGYEIVNTIGETISKTVFEEQYGKENLNKSLYPFFRLILNGCTMLIHRSHFEKVGLFDISRPTTQDYDLWFRMLRHSPIVYQNEILMKSRSHPEQTSRTLLNNHIIECEDFWLGVFSSMEKEEMISLDGSILQFYENNWKSFREKTLYLKVISYLEGKYLEEELTEYHEEKEILKKNAIEDKVIKAIGCKEGSFQTLKKIFDYKVKRKPRILFFTGNWCDRGGINRVIASVSSSLGTDYESIVCCIEENGNEDGYILDKEVGFIELQKADFEYIPQILKLLEVDIFVGSNNCFAPLLKLYGQIEDFGIRSIMWNHESYFEPFFNRGLEEIIPIRKEAYRSTSVVLWLSNLSATVGRMFNKNVLVMENPLSITVKNNYKNNPNLQNIISVARFNSPQKRIDRLIEVFAKILKKRPDVKLYIVGAYDLSTKNSVQTKETVAQVIERLKIPEESIIFTGEVKNVEEYYSKASVNIVTSERDGFGLTVLEAASCGLPSVIFNRVGASDIVEDGINGYVVQDGNLDDMADKILTLLNNEQLYKKVSENALNLVKKYTTKIVSTKWKRLIAAILDSEHSAFIQNEYKMKQQKNTEKDYEKICSLYEEAFCRQKKEIVGDIESTWIWKITKPFRKLARLIELIRTQGILVTCKNILLRIKESILR